MNNRRRPNRNRRDIFTPFFDSQGQQKKWFVVFGVLLPLLITILFSVWGTWISVKSYDLSVDASNNHDQIDTMKVIVDKLQQQNQLLIDQNKMIFTQVNQLRRITSLNENSNDIQTQHFATVRQSINDSKVPKLSIEKAEFELGSTSQADFAYFYYLKIVNYGGDIYHLRHKELDSIGNAPISLPVTSLPRNADVEITFLNPFLYTHKTKLKLRFSFEDALHTKYYQDLTLIENGDDASFQMGKMVTVAK